MGWRRIAAIVLLGISVAASVAARQGIFEYWKAGTKRGRSTSSLSGGRSRAGQPSPSTRAPSPPGLVPWSATWFADSTQVRRRLTEVTDALISPMIGQTYPLPRGGGFVCTPSDGDGDGARAGGQRAGGLRCVLQCAGPELGGRRRNWFYATDSNPAPTLDRVRWLIVAPGSSARAPWRAFVLALADSLDGSLGRPAWVGPDNVEATWDGNGYTATLRLHGEPGRVDSLEIECVSNRLAGRDRGAGAR